MDVLGQTSLLVAITSFAIGSAILARNVRNKLFLMFAILTTLISAWALFFFMAKLQDSHLFYRIHLLLNLWLAPAALAFIRLMVRMEDRLSRSLLAGSIVMAALLSVLLAFDYERIPLILQIIYFFPGVVVLQILQLMWIDSRRKRQGQTPPRRNLIYVGGLLVLASSSLDHVPMMGVVAPSLGNIALTVYLFFLSQAVSRQRLLNFGALFSRFLVLLTIALTLTLIYSTLFAWIENKPALFFLNSFIVSFLLLMLLEPIRSLVGYLTTRLLSQKYRRLEQTVNQARLQLVGVTDPTLFFQSVLSTVEQTLQPEWSAVYVLMRDGARFRRVRTAGTIPDQGEERESLREVLVSHPMLDHSRRLHQKNEVPVLLDVYLQNEIDRSASRKQREYFEGLLHGLRALQANLLIPFFDKDSAILGFVVLGVSSPPEPWGTNWGLLAQLYPYFEQAAGTMRSLEIFVRLREKERLAALGEMAAGLAHEIRNPLGAIKGAAQFLEPGESDDRPENRFLRIIIEETDRLNRVVTQFLDYSKPPTTDLKRVELSSLVEKAVEKMRPAVPSAIELKFEGERHSTHVMAAPEQIQQVLINLIQNSVRAIENRTSQSWTKQIRVKVERGANAELPEAVVSVEDTGHGIKKEHLDKLFIPFFTTTPSGTGLGLSISQKIIEAHRGRIEVATEEGRFTRVSVILPVTG